MANTWEDDAQNAYEEHLGRNASRCRCGGDMPGRCPGPANCPMCQSDDEDEFPTAINPTPADIGHKVVHRKAHDITGGKDEEGVITSFNDSFVFVRYGTNTTSAATRREDLEWTFPHSNPEPLP